MTIVSPSPAESMNLPVDVAPGAGGMATAEPGGKAPVLPPVTVDCSLAPSAAVQVAWDDVNDQEADWYSTAEALTIAVGGSARVKSSVAICRPLEREWGPRLM